VLWGVYLLAVYISRWLSEANDISVLGMLTKKNDHLPTSAIILLLVACSSQA
jgi:hypothetical protein